MAETRRLLRGNGHEEGQVKIYLVLFTNVCDCIAFVIDDCIDYGLYNSAAMSTLMITPTV